MKRLLLITAALLTSLAQAATITDVRVSGAGPITFGQVFAVGDLKKSDVLVGAIGTTAVPLQVDVKATHADGSVRHAIISAQAPKAGTMLLNTGGATTANSSVVQTDIPLVTASATIAGVKYIASPSGAFKASWLQGPVVNEWQTVMPMATADGVVHPHLTARFAIRYYTESKKTRVDVTIENDWAYEPGPQNFTYDADISIAGKSVYSKAALTHIHHARWRKVFWDGPIVQLNTNYLIASKAVPNYDQSFPPSEGLLQSLANRATGSATEPMGIGLATAYMPTTGAHDDIGILPSWAAAYVLSMDNRARNATLVTGDGAGSFSIHYRDKNTDRPVSLTNYPRMTILGKQTDTFNDAKNRWESFPDLTGDLASPYSADTAHQPSLAFLPYLVTGDYYYLEEMQFWTMYNLFKSNPNYRGYEKGWVIPEELRGQAWALRTLAQTAAFTPDADSMKADITGFMNNNIDWYNANYPNNSNFTQMKYQDGVNNKLGVMTHTFSLAYNDGTAVSTWMDDFFTSAVGYAYDLGFASAKPILDWKAKFSVARMTEVCWVMGAPYELTVRDDNGKTVYDTVAQAYAKDLGAAFMALPCAGPAFTAGWVAKVGGNGKAGDMGNISEGITGYPANMQPALAAAVDAGVPNAPLAWQLFMGRTVKPDYSQGAQFAIAPRVSAAPPVIVPPAPVKAGKVTTGSNVKLAKLTGLTVVFINPAKFEQVKTFTGVTATSKGAFTVSDVLLIPGTQYLVAVISSTGKPLDAFLLTVPQ